MKKRNASKTNQTMKRPTPKAPAKKPIDKKIIGMGAAALMVVALITAGLIWFYAESVVARINGAPIRESEVMREVAHNPHLNDLLWMQGWPWPNVRVQAVREVALARLFEDFARENDITLHPNQANHQMIISVSDAIVARTELFANFEAYMPEDPIAIGRERAEAILERALAGEDFDDLVAAYNEDGMPPEGYTFVAGAMVIEFEEAVLALEIGEIGLVQTEFGFHVIKRIEPPDLYNIMRHWADEPPPPGTEEEVFGVKHVLFRAEEFPLLHRRRAAVDTVFRNKLENADLVFLRALENLEI